MKEFLYSFAGFFNTNIPLKNMLSDLLDTFEDCSFKAVNYKEKNLQNFTFSNVIFEQCNFYASDLRNVQLIDCQFVNCNLSLIKLINCRFNTVRFEKCKLVGLEFYHCNNKFFVTTFADCLIQTCNFSDLNLKKTSFGKSVMRECYFNQTDLTEVDFSETDLSHCIFHKCDARKANFTGAINYYLDPTSNNLKKAKFSLPEAANLLKGFDIEIA